MSDFELQAFVTNLGKYNEGELVGEWVSFPVTPEEMRAVLDRIGIGHPDDFGVPYEEVFITDYDTDLYGVSGELGEYESLDKLNYLASRLEELSPDELEKYKAILESADIPRAVSMTRRQWALLQTTLIMRPLAGTLLWTRAVISRITAISGMTTPAGNTSLTVRWTAFQLNIG